ncbi:helix-turn-helix domain-containing protein [Brevibacillus agri]|uniref:helix-turn-helix domain-containing protein n=1 Tax=Paenibacillaceae TaxID=186822 RepID=UPI0002A50C9A|nr:MULTISPECIES: helix-turn-helix domain-containing protein [Paenibacillaceae]ELK43456.1 excisionase family DNA-binding domain-containing protein [Brevibacillus agri BAB-2500]MCM3622760.1 helix-turn-helix domain-containing protein [Brevibacillus borstelensis]
MERTLLTMPEVAKILGISKERSYAIARDGLLPTVRIGRQIRVDQEQLNSWIQNGGQALSGGWRRNSHE